MKTFLILMAFASITSHANVLDDLEKNYEGYAIEKSANKISSYSITATLQSTDDEDENGKKSEFIISKSVAQAPVSITFDFLEGRRNSLFYVEKVGAEPLALHYNSNECYSDDAEKIELCLDGHSVMIHTNNPTQQTEIKFALGSKNQTATLEAPQAYSVSELRTRAINRNFNSRVELEHAFQAKATSKNAKLNLLPHISIGSIIAIATMDQNGLYSAVGDIAPFLLPSRWFLAAEMKQRSLAEQDAFQVVKADSGYLVEGLSLSILRDQEILAKLREGARRVQTIRDELAAREHLGQFQPGIHDDVTSLLSQLQKSADAFSESIKEEYSALAQGAGFVNPSAVLELKPQPESERPPLTHSDSAGILNIALDRSYEIKQMDHLLLAAAKVTGERWFGWLDPAGDPMAGIGFGTVSYIQVGRSQMREMVIRREQTVSLLALRLKNLTDESNLSVDLFNASKTAASIQQRRVDRMLTNIRVGAAFSLSDLISALQDQIHNELDLINAQYSFWLAQAGMNRIQMMGAYDL